MQKKFRSLSENDIKNIFQKKNTSQKLPMDTRKQCWHPAKELLLEGWKF